MFVLPYTPSHIHIRRPSRHSFSSPASQALFGLISDILATKGISRSLSQLHKILLNCFNTWTHFRSDYYTRRAWEPTLTGRLLLLYSSGLLDLLESPVGFSMCEKQEKSDLSIKLVCIPGSPWVYRSLKSCLL